MQKLLGNDIYRVSTTPLAELGSIVEDVRGGQGDLAGLGYDAQFIRYFAPDGLYKYVKASGVGGILKGDVVLIDVTQTDEPASVIRTLTTTAGQTIEGVALVDIPQNSFGYIQIRGRIPFASSASNAALRQGIRIAAAGVAAGNVLGTTAASTAGEVALLAAVTVGSAAGRRIIALDASADDGSTTQLRCEAYILG